VILSMEQILYWVWWEQPRVSLPGENEGWEGEPLLEADRSRLNRRERSL